MPHEECTTWDETITTMVETTQKVQKTISQEVCEDCAWYCICCNFIFCWVMSLIFWVVETVLVPFVEVVTRTFCVIVEETIDLVTTAVVGFFHIIGAVAIGDLESAWRYLTDAVVTSVFSIFQITRALVGLEALGFVITKIQAGRLRDYIDQKLAGKYGGKELEAMREHLNLDSDNFGLPLTCDVYRTFVRSDSRAAGGNAPDLILMHEDTTLDLNLKELAGFQAHGWLDRQRVEVVTDDGSDFSEDDLNEYINTRGGGKPFRVYAMSEDVLMPKLDAAADRLRLLGIRMSWNVQELRVSQPTHVRHPGTPAAQCCILAQTLGRHFDGDPTNSGCAIIDANAAVAELCKPVALAMFFYDKERKKNGEASTLRESPCVHGGVLPARGTSGITFKDRWPDDVWKWVTGHELGHYFGLCHVDGLDRMMYSPSQSGPVTGYSVFNYGLYGAPVFTLDEGKKAWDYITANFSGACLMG